MKRNVPDQGVDEQLLRIVGKVDLVLGLEDGSNRF